MQEFYALAETRGRKSLLSEKKICEIAGITPQQRRALVQRGLLARTPAEGGSLRDCLHLAALTGLMATLKPQEVAVAWPQLQAALTDTVPLDRLDIVFDPARGALSIARNSDELRDLAVAGGTVRVIPLGERLSEIADAFRRWAAAIGDTSRRRRRSTVRKNA